jgi:hypothetical protein
MLPAGERSHFVLPALLLDWIQRISPRRLPEHSPNCTTREQPQTTGFLPFREAQNPRRNDGSFSRGAVTISRVAGAILRMSLSRKEKGRQPIGRRPHVLPF